MGDALERGCGPSDIRDGRAICHGRSEE
jgi:hypothetical protein